MYQATGEPQWFREARSLIDDLVRLFQDPQGGFFTTGADAEALVTEWIRSSELPESPLG